MDLLKLENFLHANKEPRFRLKQIKEFFYQKSVCNWDDITVLSVSLREKLKRRIPILAFKEKKVLKGKDSRKVILELEDGNIIETVLIENDDRMTVCLSSQVGCALGCVFCLTGHNGFKRNLTAYEMADQVVYWNNYIKNNIHEDSKVTNVVFMGMGEPFLNYDNFLIALDILQNKESLGMAARRISVSTSGIISKIEAFMKLNKQVNLAVSIHAPEDKLRASIMPVNKKNPLKNLMPLLHEYSKSTKRKIFLEYILLDDINDTPEHAQMLADLIGRNYLLHVNLTRYNPIEGNVLAPSSRLAEREFIDVLRDNRINVTLRKSVGDDIVAACGQLAGEK